MHPSLYLLPYNLKPIDVRDLEVVFVDKMPILSADAPGTLSELDQL